MITPALREALTKQGDHLPGLGPYCSPVPRTGSIGQGCYRDKKKVSCWLVCQLGHSMCNLELRALGLEKNNKGGSIYVTQFQLLSLCGPCSRDCVHGTCAHLICANAACAHGTCVHVVCSEIEPQGSRTAWERPQSRK